MTDNVEIVEVPDSILEVLLELFGEAILDLVENDAPPNTLH
jgi:hypothetical protein